MSASNKKKLRKELNTAAMTEKQRKELKEAKNLKAYTITFAVVMVLVVAILVGVLVKAPIAGMLDRNSHAVTIGEHKLSAAELNYYYVDAIRGYCDEIQKTYGNYATYFLGFDTSKPLGDQEYNKDKGTTWADHFIDEAVKNAKSIYGMYDKAIAEGHKLSDEEQTALDNSIKNLDLAAKYNHFNSAKSYIRSVYGNGSSMKSYEEYCRIGALASSYFRSYADSLTYEDQAYRDHEKGQYNKYSSYSYVYYLVSVNDYRGEPTKDENGKEIYTDEQMKKARELAEAQKNALMGVEITNKETFDTALKSLKVNEKNEKAESTEAKNALYGTITFNSDAQKWIGNSERKAGDKEYFTVMSGSGDDRVVTGYYVVVYTGTESNNMPLANVRHLLVKFEGGTKDQNGNMTYTDAEKQKAKDQAQKLLDEWKAGDATEDSFIELVKKNSADEGSKAQGGLIEDINPSSQLVESFRDWALEKHQKGDVGIVESVYGYHIMFYVGDDELTYRNAMIKAELVEKDVKEWHEKLVEGVTATTNDLSRMDYKYILH